MNISAAFLARYATIGRDGTLNVLDGAMSWIGRPAYPAGLGLNLAGLVGIEDSEINRDHPLECLLHGDQHPDTIAAALGRFHPTLNAGTNDSYGVLIPIIIDLTDLQVPAPGRYRIVLRIGNEKRMIEFEARTQTI